MNDLIEVKDGVAYLRAEIASQMAEFERMVKSIEEQKKTIKSEILKEMEEHGIIKLDSPYLTITYIAPTDREQFDSKLFRAENPLVYDEYVNMTPVKASIRVKLKEEEK